MLIITGSKAFPNRIINKNENNNNIAKYMDSSLEKKRFINLPNKVCILILELSNF